MAFRQTAGLLCVLAFLLTDAVATAASTNVVLISVDTLRADHLPTYGYPRPTAPRIAELASNAAVFERAYSPASHTLLTHVSLLTGLEPDTHAVIGYRDSLSTTVATLAELLADRGYRTGAFVNSGFLDPKFALDRGFQVYDYYGDLAPAQTDAGIVRGRTASQVNEAILDWLGEEPGRPFFLFAHYFDVHSDWKELPYESPSPFRERFERERPASFEAGDGRYFATEHLVRMNRRGSMYDEEARQFVKSLYDGGIAYADSEVGRLLDALASRGLREGSLMILLSDHGEEFQEHGKLLHEQVYEELVRVPLIVALPQAAEASPPAGKRIGSVVHLTDVMPTVLEYLGAPVPTSVQGRSLLPLLRGGRERDDPVFFRNRAGTQYGVRLGRWKLVQHVRPPHVMGKALLFDLDADPGETSDVASAQPFEVRRLQMLLGIWRTRNLAARPPPAPTALLPERVRRELEALGYVERDGSD